MPTLQPALAVLVLASTAFTIGIATATAQGPFPVDYVDPPDFAQVRPELDGGGSYHCGPTAAADALQWLANNGWGALSPLSVTDDAAASPPTSSDPPEVQLQWDQITDYIAGIGVAMETEINNSTNSWNLMWGLETYLDVYGDAFYVDHRGRASGTRSSWETGGSLDAALERMALGDMVLVNVGFYHALGERCGGHWMCMAGYSVDPIWGTRKVRIKDPARGALSMSSHTVTTETITLEEENGDDINGDGISGGYIEMTVDSWNWSRSISSKIAEGNSSCPEGETRHGYQDNFVYFGENSLWWLSDIDLKVHTWLLGRDLTGPLYDIQVFDFARLWDRPWIIYIDRPTGLLRTLNLLDESIMDIPTNIPDMRRLACDPFGMMLVTSIVDQDTHLATLLSPEGAMLGQFPLTPQSAIAWASNITPLPGGPTQPGFLVADGGVLLHAIPGQPAQMVFQLPIATGVQPRLAVDDANNMLYLAGVGDMLVGRLDLATMQMLDPIQLQIPVGSLAAGTAGWLYVTSSGRAGQSNCHVYRDGQFQRVIDQAFSGAISVPHPPHRPPSQNPEDIDWPFDLGDLDLDGAIGINDLLMVIDSWGQEVEGDADLDGDGVMAIGDLLIIIEFWS